MAALTTPSMTIYICKRGIQTFVHPQKFVRLLKLTDGSTIRVTSLAPPPPQQISSNSAPFTVSLLNLDSANHPSWNPELRDRLLLDDRGQVAKFRARFGNNQMENRNDNVEATDYSDFLGMDPDLNITEPQLTKAKVKAPVKPAVAKKKK